MAPTSAFASRLEFERSLLAQGYRLICGVDEVGRGSLAGPLVAAAVILPLERPRLLGQLHDVRDSKQLTEQQRKELFGRILRVSKAVGIGWASHHVIDRDGLTLANRRAMARAVARLAIRPEAVLIDCFAMPDCDLVQIAIVKGDDLSLSIAAASIVAKVLRDDWMSRWDQRYPQYGFAAHKGYCTARHRAALAVHGPCSLHRRSFEPVASFS